METSIQSSGNISSGNSMEECIKECLACFQSCISCISHCLVQGGKFAEPKHIGLMQECAEVCRTSATLMVSKGQFSFEFCQLCATVCDACAQSCLNVDPNDSMMQECADECRKCAAACRNMSHQYSEGFENDV